MRYRNKKNRKVYRVIARGPDHTNSREGLRSVVYHPEGFPDDIGTREEQEFDAKFDSIKDSPEETM